MSPDFAQCREMLEWLEAPRWRGQQATRNLLEMIRFRIPTGTRQQHLFELSHAARNYLRHSPIPRLMRLGNDISSSVDFFSTSLRAIKCIAADSSPDLH
ncbi:hypothetical protein J6590_035297 [Homalodisca vitripennis]|nr:hypothetical protein J6590_035297 [Homalodisca vitripennis]